jgi:hypothetical protein
MRPAALLAAVAVLAGCGGGGKPSPSPSAPAMPIRRTYDTLATVPPAQPLESPSPAASASPAEDPVRRQVQNYFARIDQTLRPPKHGVTAQVADASVLLATLQQKSEQVRKLEVPAPAAEHHRQTLELLDAAMALADRMRVLKDTQDKSALLAFETDRRSLDEQEKRLDALATEIKQALEIR